MTDLKHCKERLETGSLLTFICAVSRSRSWVSVQESPRLLRHGEGGTGSERTLRGFLQAINSSKSWQTRRCSSARVRHREGHSLMRPRKDQPHRAVSNPTLAACFLIASGPGGAPQLRVAGMTCERHICMSLGLNVIWTGLVCSQPYHPDPGLLKQAETLLLIWRIAFSGEVSLCQKWHHSPLWKSLQQLIRQTACQRHDSQSEHALWTSRSFVASTQLEFQ